MNAPRSSRSAPRLANPRRFIVLAVLLLLFSLAVLFWARPLIRELVVLPLSYLFWAAGVFFDTTPQRFFWTALLILSALIAYRSLVGARRVFADPPPELLEADYDRPFRGQVSLWLLKINTLRRSESSYLHSSFEQSVGKLLFDALAYRNRLSVSEVEHRLRENTLDVPPAVRDYALDSLRRLDSEPQSEISLLWQEIVARIKDWFFKGREQSLPPSPRLERDLERLQLVLSFLEKDLEVPSDDTGQ